MNHPSRLIGEVRAGDALPPLVQPVTATTVVLGALASRDWRPMHHDRDFAIHRNGVKDIFINTPNNAAWFERYVTDWSGPKGRLGRMAFRMIRSVFPGDEMVFSGKVVGTTCDDTGCHWADLELAVSVGGSPATTCTARIALPADEHDNPWMRRAERWKP